MKIPFKNYFICNITKKKIKIEHVKVIKLSNKFFEKKENDNFLKGLTFKSERILDRTNFVKRKLFLLQDDHEDIWHHKYGEIDSGNIIDDNTEITLLLDELRKKMGLEKKNISFDKFTLRKQDYFNLSTFHSDHFNDANNFMQRKNLNIFRLILNLNKKYYSRFAVLDLDKEIISSKIKDPFNVKDYIDLYNSVQDIKINIYLIPPYNKKTSRYNAIKINVFNTIHCAFGYKGDFKAILTDW
ncbi:MAG: hypothetical protein VX089_00325 [Pseudomonadota bacterium]|nr:hypothetical protein [Pseudomonadota bacterium]